MAPDGQGVQIDNRCPNGVRCGYAHSKDEVLYHPSIFKTRCCEDHRETRAARRGRRAPRCHRHYCPFAHGAQELRSSPLTHEAREAIVFRALDLFSSDSCCRVCTPVRLDGQLQPPQAPGATAPSNGKVADQMRAPDFTGVAPMGGCGAAGGMMPEEFWNHTLWQLQQSSQSSPRSAQAAASWWAAYAAGDLNPSGLVPSSSAQRALPAWAAGSQDLEAKGKGMAEAGPTCSPYGQPAPLAESTRAAIRPPPPSAPVPPPPASLAQRQAKKLADATEPVKSSETAYIGGFPLAAAAADGVWMPTACFRTGLDGQENDPPYPPYPYPGMADAHPSISATFISLQKTKAAVNLPCSPSKEENEWTHLLSSSLVEEILLEE